MVTARVLTHWLEADPRSTTGPTFYRRYAVPYDHPWITGCEVTGTPGDQFPLQVPLVVVEGTWTDKAWQALLDDPAYGLACVLWNSADQPKTAILDAATIDQIKQRITVGGIAQPAVDAVFAAVRPGDRREALETTLNAALRVPLRVGSRP